MLLVCFVVTVALLRCDLVGLVCLIVLWLVVLLVFGIYGDCFLVVVIVWVCCGV